MTATKEQLIGLYDHQVYRDILHQLEPIYEPGIDYKTLYDASIERDMKALTASGFSLDQLFSACKEHKEELISYCILKYKFVLFPHTDDQEYPEGEEPGEDEKDIILAILPFNRNFLFCSLIEFLLLKTDSDLSAYMKTMRQPNAKKYIAKIKELFDQRE